MMIGLAPTLAYPFILDCDWLEFTRLLWALPLGAVLSQEVLERDPAENDEAKEEKRPNTEGMPTLVPGPSHQQEAAVPPDFSPDQWEDPTLCHAYEQLARVDCNVIEPQWVAQWPRFELTSNRLYPID